jgi:acyl carrier protein
MTGEQERMIREFLKNRFAGFRDSLTVNDSLDSIVDSVGQFELVGFLESTFKFRIPNEEFRPDRFATIARIGAVIEQYSGSRR